MLCGSDAARTQTACLPGPAWECLEWPVSSDSGTCTLLESYWGAFYNIEKTCTPALLNTCVAANMLVKID